VLLRSDRLLELDPIVDLALGLLLGVAVTLLQKTEQLFTLSVDARDVIVGELCPLLFDSTLELRPVALDLIPIHFSSS
jgi:hypothetical protein